MDTLSFTKVKSLFILTLIQETVDKRNKLWRCQQKARVFRGEAYAFQHE